MENKDVIANFQGTKIFNDKFSAEFHINELEENETIYIQNEGLFIKKDNILEPVESNIGINMSLYEINKNVYAQLPKRTEEELAQFSETLTKFYKNISNARTMLLCREMNYYTIFEFDDAAEEFETAADAIVTCVGELGELLDVVENEAGLEVWVKLFDSAEVVMMVLFDCESMFVTYRSKV